MHDGVPLTKPTTEPAHTTMDDDSPCCDNTPWTNCAARAWTA